MKTAIYTDQNIQQIVLTPENEIDKVVFDCLSKLVNYKTNWLWVDLIEETEMKVRITKGSFYECKGWWTRQWWAEDSIIIWFPIDNEKRLSSK